MSLCAVATLSRTTAMDLNRGSDRPVSSRMPSSKQSIGSWHASRHHKNTMNPIKHIFLTLIQLVKQVYLFPQTVVNAFKHSIKEKQRQVILNKREAERLD